MKIERGMIFRDTRGHKCYIANTFMEGEHEVTTYRFWSKHGNRWIFVTDFTDLFLIGFTHGGYKWESK